MIFDKNAKRIKELQKKLTSICSNPEKVKERIKSLQEVGPEWWIDYYDSRGVRRAEKSTVNTQKGAERFELRRKQEIVSGQFDAPDQKKVKIEEIIEFYLKSKPRGSSSRTLCKHINRLFGNVYLHRIDSDPQILVAHFQNFPEKNWSEKYVWNYYVTLKASIAFWLKMKRLVMSNPCDIVPELTEMNPYGNIREQTPTEKEFRLLISTAKEKECDPWVIDLFEAVWESGLRIGEVMKWRVEDICLDIEKDKDGNVVELPYFTTFITKQRRITRKQIPMSFGLWQVLKRVIADKSEGWVWPVRCPPYKYIREKEIMEKAGLQKYRPFHDFRKSFKVAMKKKGMSQEFTKYLQGHATNSMDDYYTQFSRLDVQDAHLEGYRDLFETKEIGNETTGKKEAVNQ